MRTLHGTVVERDGQSLIIELEIGLRVTAQRVAGLGIWDECNIVYDFRRKEVKRIEKIVPSFYSKVTEPEPTLDLPGEVGDLESTQEEAAVDVEMEETLAEEAYHDPDDVLNSEGDRADILLPLGDAS
jgi:hypothetical protein